MQAIIDTYGLLEGLATSDGVITKWPYGASQPSQKDLDDLVALYNAKEIKKKAINDQRDVAVLADLTITLDSTAVVELQVTHEVYFSLQGIIDKGSAINWILKDNTTVSFVTADFITFRDALITRNGEAYQARKRKDALIALTTVSTVEAYDITTTYI